MKTEDTHLKTPSNAAELLAAGKAIAVHPVDHGGRDPVVIVPQGWELHPLPHRTPAPLLDHIQQQVILTDPPSFSQYVKRYQGVDTVLFASLPDASRNAEFSAVFDYHAAAKEGDGTEDTHARRCAHRAVYPCPPSLEWKRWLGVHAKPMAQTEFIEFIDQNAPDVQIPDTATLMSLAMNFEARTNVTFRSTVDRVTGGRQLTFVEQIDAGSGTRESTPEKVKVPENFTLVLPIFEGGKPFEQHGRFEWQVRDGKLKIVIHLRRPEETVRKALADLREDIQAATGLEPMYGRIGS